MESSKRLVTIVAVVCLASGWAPLAAGEKRVNLSSLPRLRDALERQTPGENVPEGVDESQATPPQSNKEAEDQAKSEAAEKSFLGINLGVGFGASFDLDGGGRVEEVILDENKIVRVQKERNPDPRILFEVHKLFEKGLSCYFVQKEDGGLVTREEYRSAMGSVPATPSGCTGGVGDGDPVVLAGKGRIARWGHGPFATLVTTKDNDLSTFGLGYMVGWRKPGGDNNSTNSFNIGLALIVDSNVKTLGDGVVANQPLPMGETEIRIKEESRLGLAVLASFSF